MSKPRVTPKGVFVYPCLTKPDTKFDADGRYKVGLRLPADVAQPLVDEINTAIQALVEQVKAEKSKAAGKPFTGKVKQVDPSYTVDEESGDVTFNFKMKASGKRKDGTVFTQKPSLKKHDLTDIDPGTSIWGGSEGKVAFEMSPFYTGGLGAGVSLRLKGVQVIKLVSGGSADCGFEAEEGGEGFEDTATTTDADDNDSPDEAYEGEEAVGAQDF